MGRGVNGREGERPANWDWVPGGLALLLLPALAWGRIGLSVDRAGLAVAAGGLSLITFSVYGADKRWAGKGAGRVPEWLLHTLEAAGGWPGAFVAQRVWRHKNAKASYQAFFWSIVIVHQVLALDYLLGWRLARALRDAL